MSGCKCGCGPADDRMFSSGCACDHARFPPVGPIAAGLADLPRQRAGFGEYRDHLLSSVRGQPALDGWKARDNDDLGLMLLESWAYVLDVTGFYDARISEECYIRTAKQRPSLRKLTTLTGYRPRPAVGATVYLGAFADGNDPVTIPAGTGFRSKAFAQEAPQLFELDTDTIVHPARNSWIQAPERSTAYEGMLAFAPNAPGVATGQIALVLAGTVSHAARVASVTGQKMPDGDDYRVVVLDPPPTLSGLALADIEIATFSQSASPTVFTPSGSNTATAGTTFVILDSIYPQIRPGDRAIIEKTNGALIAVSITSVPSASVILSESGANAVTTKVTKIVFAALSSTPDVARVHFRKVPAGRLTNPARTEFAAADLLGAHGLQPPVRLPSDLEPPAALLAQGEGNAGVRYSGTTIAEGHGQARVEANSIDDAATDLMAGPIVWHGNVLKATRGQTVFNEVLGSGNSAKPYQSFRLRKKPLTYLPSSSAAGGVAPELEVRVNGILWTRSDSFLTARPGARVYVVRHDDAGETEIVFGDLTRPPTGSGNVTATYRYGAGAAAPPPGAISQLAKRTPGLFKVVSPMMSAGGSDAEGPDEIRSGAPVKMMTTGRAVSVADYNAFAAAYPGVANATAAWAWDGRFQRATVKVWVISNGASIAGEVGGYLAGVGDGVTAVKVDEAQDIGADIVIEIDVDGDHDRTIVAAAVTSSLTDPKTGFFAPARVTIGAPFYRSAIIAAVMAVEGVLSVRSIAINGEPAPTAIAVPEGSYLAFETVTIG